MKAAVLYEKHDLRIEEIPTPKCDDENNVIVKVAYCGICGTDVQLFEGEEGSVRLIPGTVPGHELSGTIVGTGEKVVVDPNYYCGQCKQCLAMKPHYCENIFNTGVTVNGGFAEYVKAHRSQIHKIPEHVKLEDAAYAEPISCCLHGARLTKISKGDRVLIIGAGTIGLIMLQICKSMNADYIAVSEPIKSKRITALSLGADAIFDSNNISTHQLSECKFNKIIECSGNINAVKTAIDSCCETGTVMLFGLTNSDDTVAIKPFDLFKRELTIKSSYINPYTMADAIQMISQGIVTTSKLTSDLIELDQLPTVLADHKNKLKNGKVLVKFT